MFASAASLFSSAFAAALRPLPDIRVSEWADEFRIVGKPSPWEGKWETNRVPYTREIMDNFAPSSPVEITSVMKAAQGAGTEILLNVLGCIMHRHPDSTMLVLPSINSAKRFVRTRLDPMIEITPSLRKAVAKPRSRDASNTTSIKEFGGAQLVIVGANSGIDVRSYPAANALLDEVDAFQADLDNEGDTTDLIIQRTGAFANRKVGLVSTPTLAEISLIAKWHQQGDQRLYYVPCPFCRREQALIFGEDRAREGRLGGLRWDKGHPDQAKYECEYESCGGRFEEWRKIDPILRGYWVPQAPGVGGGKNRSYQINALYYPYGGPGNAWVNLATAWERDHKNPIKRKTFWNLKLGLPYRDPSEAKADAAELAARAESYGPTIPAQVASLTFGGDVQGNRIEVELVGWGPEEESWSIEHTVFLGDTSRLVSSDPDRPTPWQQLAAWVDGEWLSELGLPMRIAAGCVDAGYQTHLVAKWCGERFTRKIWATKGMAGNRPIWPRKPGRTKNQKSPIFTVGCDTAKEVIYGRLRLPEPGPGYCHFPKNYPLSYYEQLTSEIRIPDYSRPIPIFTWKKKSESSRNEVLDCRNEAYEALCGLIAGGLRLNQEHAKLKELAEALAKPAKAPALNAGGAVAGKEDWLRGRGNDWL